MTQPVSAKPMYQKIRERLERDIAGGRYPAGGKFPSEAALVQRFGASRITVGRAVRELQERGLLDRVAGSGTYVRGAAQRAPGGSGENTSEIQAPPELSTLPLPAALPIPSPGGGPCASCRTPACWPGSPARAPTGAAPRRGPR